VERAGEASSDGDAKPDGLAVGEVKPSPSLRDISLKIAIKENLDILKNRDEPGLEVVRRLTRRKRASNTNRVYPRVNTWLTPK
jgi:hypothetical protein